MQNIQTQKNLLVQAVIPPARVHTEFPQAVLHTLSNLLHGT